ncbi:heme lyase CcmF/NrfE family subunit [Polynucleobacter sp.]|uniref:heme lyase CcmF/NrfE family subunit n=1 Tax=Polynucleobacter sp. TaxID=2029855 RepID=UPI0027362EA2|nr:heme lyase CcmF/NrfE family subunit [Polynucleobacter sp.]MDP3122011.1 heme lyase CcmF/NrfE family subunit [Polynucleobacter sp.]
MIPEIGQVALILALMTALVLGIAPLIGAQTNRPALMNLARPSAMALFLWVTVSYICLVISFINNDFSVLNVAQNSNSALPLMYRIGASWGSHEGSILLWCFMMAGWTIAVAVFSKHLPIKMISRILGVLGLLNIGVLLFTLLTSNPLDRMLPAALEGKDLNPLLQDPGMIIHPPFLYMGYVGSAVAFAFAIAALLSGRLDAAWARWSRPWVTSAWCFLTIGIALGSAWAYYELGWGGWWFWDPVENASFMPWLVGTALIHSLAVTEKRGGFKMWTALLAILAFSLSLLGTFLVRSGVITSVHAFATDPKRGIFILGFLALVVGGSLLLFAWRAPKANIGGDFGTVSRESMLLSNNVLLLVATAAVLLGTLYPMLLDALDLGKISVGVPYFEAVFVPLMTPALFLIGIGPIARWRQSPVIDLAHKLKWAATVSVISAILAPLVLRSWTPLVGFGLFLAIWIIATTFTQLIERAFSNRDRGVIKNLAAQPASYYGMFLAHIGVAVFIIGVTGVRGFESEKDIRMAIGSSIEAGGYDFQFLGVQAIDGPNYKAIRGVFDVTKGGKLVTRMAPEKRVYNASQMPMTEAAIDPGFTRDLYVSLGEPINANEWTVRIHIKPFVDWIWGGCLFMALGGFLAITDRRYRKRK